MLKNAYFFYCIYALIQLYICSFIHISFNHLLYVFIQIHIPNNASNFPSFGIKLFIILRVNLLQF